ncbi:ABC transporter ATP-binding protein [Microbacterium sp. str. 'China']|uniref:ABC transporter ATP-binding protein n=1 Tax=Microbacterium sp. str. 'China' TaxID=2103230 RepID=UPI001F3992D7|nr:ABC transporter ATP-binding protein [Microbacterium sp. str. 'China']
MKKPTAARPAPTKAAAEKAAPTSEVVVEPTPAASVDPAAARTASAARAAAVKNTAARTTSPKRPSATTTKPSTAAAKTTAAKTAAAKAAAAKTAAAKASAARTTAKTTAAKTAAAKAAAAKAAAAKAAEAEAAEAQAAEAAAADAQAAEALAAAETQPEESAAVVASDDGTSESATRVADAAAIEESAAEPAVEVSDTALPVTKEPALEESRVADVEVVEVVEAVIAAEPPAEVDEEEAAEPATEAIRIRGLVKQFGENRAVDGIDLTVPAASFYGIVGPNGAGKTTTLSIVAGLLRADEGSVLICGIDQASEPLAAKRVMGVLPDRLRTFDRLTGRQLLYYYGLLRGLAADVIEKRTGDLARAFDLGDALNRVVSDYSAGMTKKIMLAGAMIHSPRVLVLDEPFESVDPVSSAVILDILRAYVSHGGTVILSSHGMDLVERVCSRVAIIVNGEVLAEGTIDEVRAGQTLESRFVELAGSSGEVEGLEWLHTFSD